MRDPPELPSDLRRLLPLLVGDDEASLAWRREIKAEVDAWFAAVTRVKARFAFHLRAAIARREAEGR
jgi:hypothetical protein